MRKLWITIVKHLKKLNWLLWQRKISFLEKRKNQKHNHLALITTVILSCFIGTYLDFFFVQKQMYHFPIRPFPTLFTMNIAFTCFLLPIFTIIFLYVSTNLSTLSRSLFIMFIGICASLSERIAEHLGLFTHSENWHHSYSFFGYIMFFFLIWKCYQWSRG
ncbi:CBO0543 family protein [Bacillus cytotoxicus]